MLWKKILVKQIAVRDLSNKESNLLFRSQFLAFCLKELASAINSGNAENAEFHIKELIQCTRKLGEVELTYSTSDKPQQDQEKTCRSVLVTPAQSRTDL